MENQLFQRAKIVSVYNELTEDVAWCLRPCCHLKVP